MSLYELLLTLHIVAAATWFGSSLAITVMGIRALKTGGIPFGTLALNAGWWAGRAHPAAGVVILLAGIAMVLDDPYDFSDGFVGIGIAGLVVAMGIGGALIGPASTKVMEAVETTGGTLPDDMRGTADRLLFWSRIELAVLLVVIAVMVAKPGV